MITPDEIARLRELEKKATPGPWKYDHKGGFISIGGKFTAQTWNKGEEDFDNAHANGFYASAAANALPDLLDEVERLNKVLNQTDLELDMARRDRDKAEAERDATKAILSDPEAVHTNIMLGRITLPDYYVRTTDTNGPFAKLTADLAAALKRAEMLQEALIGIVGIIPPAMAKKWPNNMARADAALKAGAK